MIPTGFSDIHAASLSDTNDHARDLSHAHRESAWGSSPGGGGGRDGQDALQYDAQQGGSQPNNPSVGAGGIRASLAQPTAQNLAAVPGPGVSGKLRPLPTGPFVELGNGEQRAGYSSGLLGINLEGQVGQRLYEPQQAQADNTKGSFGNFFKGLWPSPNVFALSVRRDLIENRYPISASFSCSSTVSMTDRLALGAQVGSHARIRHQPGSDNVHPWHVRYDSQNEPACSLDFIRCLRSAWGNGVRIPWLASNFGFSHKGRRITVVKENLAEDAHRARCRQIYARNHNLLGLEGSASWSRALGDFWRRWILCEDSYDHLGHIVSLPARAQALFNSGHNARKATSPFRIFKLDDRLSMTFELHSAKPWNMRLWLNLRKLFDFDFVAYAKEIFGLELPDWFNVETGAELGGNETTLRRATYQSVHDSLRRGIGVETLQQKTQESTRGVRGRTLNNTVNLQTRRSHRVTHAVATLSHYPDLMGDKTKRRANAELVAAVKNVHDPLSLPEAMLAGPLDAHAGAAWLATLEGCGQFGHKRHAQGRIDEQIKFITTHEDEYRLEGGSVLRTWPQGINPRFYTVVSEQRNVTLNMQKATQAASIGEETQIARTETLDSVDACPLLGSEFRLLAKWSPPGAGELLLQDLSIDLNLRFAQNQDHKTLNALLADLPPIFEHRQSLPCLPSSVPIGDRTLHLQAKFTPETFAQLRRALLAHLNNADPSQPAVDADLLADLAEAAPCEKQVRALGLYICRSETPLKSLQVLSQLHDATLFTLAERGTQAAYSALSQEFHRMNNAFIGAPESINSLEYFMACAATIYDLKLRIEAAQKALDDDCLITFKQQAAAKSSFNVLLEDLDDCLCGCIGRLPLDINSALGEHLVALGECNAIRLNIAAKMVRAPDIFGAIEHEGNSTWVRDTAALYKKKIEEIRLQKRMVEVPPQEHVLLKKSATDIALEGRKFKAFNSLPPSVKLP